MPSQKKSWSHSGSHEIYIFNRGFLFIKRFIIFLISLSALSKGREDFKSNLC